MVKIALLPLLALTIPFINQKPAVDNYHSGFESALITETNERVNKTLTGIASSNTNVRIYAEFEIDEISDTAFQGTTFTSLMISNYVTHMTDNVFANSSIVTVNYTGSKEEFSALNLSFDINHVNEYAFDEGFINYWNKEIRPEENTNICNITQQTFSKVYSLYKALEIDDKNYVDTYEEEEEIDIDAVQKEIDRLESELVEVRAQMKTKLAEILRG